jgi:carboxy-cis,cis-muconate cyclase
MPPSSDGRRNLYATSWSEPPAIVAYNVPELGKFEVLGQATVQSRSGYVTATRKAVYSAGGATGEVFALDSSGNFQTQAQSSTPLQKLNFVEDIPQRDDGSTLDFGGLRHGAHSADLSPDEKALYIADIGRNCIWTYAVEDDGRLTLGEKHISPREGDGPRHVWPHPTGRVVYCLQEHTCMVDVFSCDEAGTKLKFEHGVRIIPDGRDEKMYWADEVRTSSSNGDRPRYMYASTRGLKSETMGYVAVFALTEDGLIDDKKGKQGLLDMFETPTSGGWANAVQPGPTIDGVEFMVLTDSEEGLVMILAWDGERVKEAARVKLNDGDGGAATGVWW